MRLFSGDDPFGAGAFAGPSDVAEECPGRTASQEQPFVQILGWAANQHWFYRRLLVAFSDDAQIIHQFVPLHECNTLIQY